MRAVLSLDDNTTLDLYVFVICVLVVAYPACRVKCTALAPPARIVWLTDFALRGIDALIRALDKNGAKTKATSALFAVHAIELGARIRCAYLMN